MNEDIQTLGSARFGDLDEIVEYLTNNYYFYPDIKCICECLKKNSFNYQNKSVSFKKIFWRSKKDFLRDRKNFWTLIKNITCLIKKKVECCSLPRF